MISRFFNARRRSEAALPAIPPGMRIYAIGDIHGCDDLLENLLAQIDADDSARGPAQTVLIFLGDVVDRGPDSAGVVERLIGIAKSRDNVRFLAGNHEEVFLNAIAGDAKALRLFSRIGGRETILSYGLDAVDYERMDYDEMALCLQQLVPQQHRAFLASFEDMISIGDYAFVHAGVRPKIAFENQRGIDLRWIRDTFLDHEGPFEKRVVHGHTILPEIDIQPNRIGIDTGAYASGRLTALGLEDNTVWQLQT